MNILTKINQEITKQTLVLDNQIAKVEKDIPTFKAINVGAIIYSDNLKECIQNEKEFIKMHYDNLKQTENEIKKLQVQHDNIVECDMNEEDIVKKIDFQKIQVNILLNSLKRRN